MKRISLLLIVSALILNSCAQQKATKTADRLEWWKDSKFGMFLHWGLYSQTGGDWKANRIKGMSIS